MLRSPLAARRPLRSAALCAALLVGLSVVASGCFSFLHPGSTSRTIDAPVGVVFSATIDVLERDGFPIARADRERGRIVTGRRPVWVVESRRRVEQADVELRASGTSTRVRLLLTFVDQASGDGEGPEQQHRPNGREVLRKSLSAGARYDDYLDAIEDRVDELMDDRATASTGAAEDLLNVLETGGFSRGTIHRGAHARESTVGLFLQQFPPPWHTHFFSASTSSKTKGRTSTERPPSP